MPYNLFKQFKTILFLIKTYAQAKSSTSVTNRVLSNIFVSPVVNLGTLTFTELTFPSEAFLTNKLLY